MRDNLHFAIQLRSNAKSTKGGDVDLLLSIAQLLKTVAEVTIVYGPIKDPSRFNGIVFANIDRPIEAYETAKAAVSCGVRTHLVALHHPRDAVESYLRNIPVSLKSAFARASGYDAFRYEQLHCMAHQFMDIAKLKRPRYYNLRKCQEYLLDYCSSVFVVNPLESAAIVSDLDITFSTSTERFIELPHPIELPSISEKPVVDGDYLLVPGRLEFRKNQLYVAKIAADFMDRQFVFVGKPSNSEYRYVQSLMRQISLSHNCRLIDHCEPYVFWNLVAHAKAVISASWFEVTSLIEIGALHFGVPVLSNNQSYLSHFVDTNYPFLGSDIPSSICRLGAPFRFKLKYPDLEDLKKTLVNSLISQQ